MPRLLRRDVRPRLLLLALIAAAPACTVDDTVPSNVADTSEADVGVDVSDVHRDVASSGPCDLTGTWAAKASVWALDDAFSSNQRSNNWFYFEIVDYGETFEIVRGFDCGIRVEGAASVTLTAESTAALMARNEQTGRLGTFVPNEAGGCDLTTDRWFWIRGGAESLLPRNFSPLLDLDLLQERAPLPTESDTDGAEDWGGTGNLGIAYQVGGAVGGTRNVVQRDWNEYFTSDEYPIETWPLDDFTVDFDYDSDEELLSVTNADCPPGLCGILETGSSPNPNGDHHIRFVRVDPDEIAGESDLETCFNIQDLIPFQRP